MEDKILKYAMEPNTTVTYANNQNLEEVLSEEIQNKLLEYAMEPNTTVTYANNQNLKEVPFLTDMMQKSVKELRNFRKYIVFGCLNCGALGTSSQPLQRCKGCDLVTFCGTKCRKKQWESHKFLCKQFLVINGKNVYSYVIDCGENRADYESTLYMRTFIAQQFDPYLAYLFVWQRICVVCNDAITENLTDCDCSCVAYCSFTCKKVDYGHQKMCRSMKIIAQIYSFYRNHEEKNIPSIIDGTVQKIYKPMKSLDSELIRLPIQNSLGKNYKWVDAITAIMSERLAYPMAILFVLQKLAHIPLKSEGLPISKVTSLTIHVAHRHPVLDSSVWEYFLHCLPELKQLNIVFISPAMFKPEQSASLCSNVDLKLERCQDCAARDRIITYSVLSLQYNKYFSSDNYIEPDVVVIYDADSETQFMMGEECHTSVKNMTYDSNTLLVLVDSSKPSVRTNHSLKDTVEIVRHMSSPPLEVILTPQPNRLTGFNSTRQLDNVPESVHVACLQNKIIS